MSKNHNQSGSNTINIKTFFVGKNGQVTIICPACSNAKTISVKQFNKPQFSIKTRCNCSHRFMINLDYRKSYRKSTTINGVYRVFHPTEDEGPAKVRDVSLNGICFETTGNHSMRIGQKGFIDFQLESGTDGIVPIYAFRCS